MSFKNYRAPYKNLLTGMIVPNDNAEEGVEKLSEVKGAEVIRSEEGRRRRDRNAPKGISGSSTRIKTVKTGSNKPKPRQEAESKNKSKKRRKVSRRSSSKIAESADRKESV